MRLLKIAGCLTETATRIAFAAACPDVALPNRARTLDAASSVE
jgi:hypothetical protein